MNSDQTTHFNHQTATFEHHPKEHSHQVLNEHSEAEHHKHSHNSKGHSHEHRSFADIRQIIESSSLHSDVKKNAIDIFYALAVAEAEVHRTEPEKVHFHEVGATDSIIDIVGAAIAFHRLGLEGISISPLPVGNGTVRCAHGIYPLPAPATAALIRNYQLPVSMDNEDCEMLTPTGAAILAVWEKKTIPSGAILTKIAHSFGHNEMKSRPNLLRASIYEISTDQNNSIEINDNNKSNETETLSLFECNIDDVSGEILASVMNFLFEKGALDVWFTPIIMKKSRPAYLLSVLTTKEKRETVLETLFQHSGTFGVREQEITRHSLRRRWENVETKFGVIRVKIGSRFGTDLIFSPEFEDCLAASKQSKASVLQIMQTVFSELERQKS